MNLWQMSNRSLKWNSTGGYATEQFHGATIHHYSIHPQGRTDKHREKQRKHRVKRGK